MIEAPRAIMRRRLLLPAVTVIALAAAGTCHAALGTRLYFPLDGDVIPAFVPEHVTPTIVVDGRALDAQAAARLRFDDGMRDRGLVLGGQGSPFIAFRNPDLVNTTEGTAAFWVQPLDFDSTDQVGLYFFRLLDNAFLYKYQGHEDTVSFYCKHARYDRYLLHSGTLELRGGQWRHVTVTWLDEVLRIYVDGRQVAAHFLWEPMNPAEHGQGIAFGMTSGDAHICLDEFYLLDYPLNDSEVARFADSYRDGGEPVLPGPQQARANVVYYPGLQKVRAWVEITPEALAGGREPARARLALLTPEGAAWDLGETGAFEQGMARATFDVPEGLPTGSLRLRATITDAARQQVAEATSGPFERRIYPWQAEDKGIGVSDEVMPPFTPLRVEGRSVHCWGRRYDLGDDGWPAQIMTREADMLTGPVRLRARVDGVSARPLAGGTAAFGRTDPGVVEFAVRGTGGSLGASLTGRIEYDGMIKYTLRLDPPAPVTVNELRLEIPVADDHALLYHVCRDAIRTSNEAGLTPPGTGKVWGSSAKPSRQVLGTFVPYWWVGDYDRGLCWMADNDRGWSVPDDEDCVELVREGDTLTARVNFITRDRLIESPWEVTFALEAGPPRPEPKGWRMGRVPGNPDGFSDFK
ncbi:MAG TPA: glycoside hydrolase domain-containing protein, partial [Armatimonadota bacterium]|nr:glycoside hydrolase domain-containing protein [Armatimonadota bacterium]